MTGWVPEDTVPGIHRYNEHAGQGDKYDPRSPGGEVNCEMV